MSPHAFSCSSIHELHKALRGWSLASPWLPLATAKPGQVWTLRYQSRPQSELLLPVVSSAFIKGYHYCSRTIRKDFQTASHLLQHKAWQLQLASSAVRFAPGQPVYRFSNVSGACPVLLTATGAIMRSKLQEVNDLVSQSFAVSLSPKAAKC